MCFGTRVGASMCAVMLSAGGNNAQEDVTKGEKVFLNVRAGPGYLICVENTVLVS